MNTDSKAKFLPEFFDRMSRTGSRISCVISTTPRMKRKRPIIFRASGLRADATPAARKSFHRFRRSDVAFRSFFPGPVLGGEAAGQGVANPLEGGGVVAQNTGARACGVWTYEPRQGRKAATAVCFAIAAVTLASFAFAVFRFYGGGFPHYDSLVAFRAQIVNRKT